MRQICRSARKGLIRNRVKIPNEPVAVRIKRTKSRFAPQREGEKVIGKPRRPLFASSEVGILAPKKPSAAMSGEGFAFLAELWA